MSVEILTGDCREVLRTLPDQSVHCVTTSPPYFGLRSYLPDGHPDKALEMGSEPTPDEFVAALVEVFREVRRVLRDDGTLWLNLGDSYASRPNGSIGKESRLQGAFTSHTEFRRAHALRKPALPGGFKHKDLMGMPWRVAFALQEDGWWLRRDIVWHKLNPMPESVTDRPTGAHEFIFLMTKSLQYFYDAEAIEEPVTGGAHRRKPGPGSRERVDQVPVARKGVTPKSAAPGSGIKANSSFHAATGDLVETRNKRSVWSVATQPFRDAHFATYPPALIEPCILAGCPKGGTVLDPFGGSGTTGMVADRLGRNAILIELNPDSVEIARKRLTADAGMFAAVS